MYRGRSKLIINYLPPCRHLLSRPLCSDHPIALLFSQLLLGVHSTAPATAHLAEMHRYTIITLHLQDVVESWQHDLRKEQTLRT